MPKDTGLRTEPGRAGLFTDARVTWAVSRSGGVRGWRILEIGPLEHAAIDGFAYEFVEQSSKEALEWTGFCGGSAPTSRWLSRLAILDFLGRLGYRRIEMTFKAPEHPNGPAFAVYADKASGST